MISYKKDCLKINGKQSVKLEKGFIEFKNYSIQIPVPFKIYADFECILRSCNVGIDNDCFSYTKKYQDHVSNIRFVLMTNLVKILCCIKEKMLFLNLLT